MTDTRKPYDPTWPHGFETRDGRKAVMLGTATDRILIWKVDGEDILPLTTDTGASRHFCASYLDIFCTPVPVEKPLECWVNVYSDGDWSMFDSHEDAARSGGYGRPGERIAVHMREVTAEPLVLGAGRMGEATFGAPAAKEPGSLSAAEVEKLATRWSGWWRHDGCSVMWHDAADALRSAARGEW